MEPAWSAPVLLLIAAVAVAVLLVLVIRLKLHAFIALVLVSVLTAIAAGIPAGDIPDVLLDGFGGTLAEVALLVGFGVMLGRLLEVTGGAQVLADVLVSRFGEKRAPLALGVASLVFGLPIFFDAGLVVFLPIVLTVARRFGGSLLFYALPSAGAFAATHAFLPPHPGPVAAANLLEADIGMVLLVGLLIALPSWFVGVYLVSRVLGRRIFVDLPDVLLGEQRDSQGQPKPPPGGEGGGERVDLPPAGPAGTSPATGTTTSTATVEAETEREAETTGQERPAGAPAFGTVFGLLLLPIVLIGLNTVTDTLGSTEVIDPGGIVARTFLLVGQTPIALLITLLVAVVVLGRRQDRSWRDVEDLLDGALGPIASVVLITGAGGMFGGVLEASGIGGALEDSLADIGLPVIVAAFVIATAMRVAIGSATVALTTAAGLIGPTVAGGDYSAVQSALVVTAIAAGATVLSHVNDSGFWLVSRFFGMDEATTLRTWTVMETTLGGTAFLLALAAWVVV
ncbi:GntP family permease [Aquipuribacter sp. SD81]|uniref:GntP family permease n=1 Tax=Aquipuribacter sp. SD81 TaxID=3127703 RepID=UPI003018500E